MVLDILPKIILQTSKTLAKISCSIKSSGYRPSGSSTIMGFMVLCSVLADAFKSLQLSYSLQ